jgi:hypothetical protein
MIQSVHFPARPQMIALNTAAVKQAISLGIHLKTATCDKDIILCGFGWRLPPKRDSPSQYVAPGAAEVTAFFLYQGLSSHD